MKNSFIYPFFVCKIKVCHSIFGGVMKKYLIIAMLSFCIAGCSGPDLEQATSELNALLDDSKIGKYVEESTILTLPKKADEHGYGIRISVEASKDFNELTSKDKYLLIKDLQKLYYELYSDEDDEVSCGKQDCYVQEIELKAGLLTYNI